MLANDARILTRSAVATAVAGTILVITGAVVGGGKGALGAAFAVLLVAVFFTLSVVAVSTAQRWGGTAMMATALGTFLVKIVAVAVLVTALRDTTLFSTRIFGVTAILCILVWSGGQVAALARRMPYVEPAAHPAARSQPHAAAPRPPGEAVAGAQARAAGARPATGEPGAYAHEPGGAE